MTIPNVNGDVRKPPNSYVAADNLKWKAFWQYIFGDKSFLGLVIACSWKFILRKDSKNEKD